MQAWIVASAPDAGTATPKFAMASRTPPHTSTCALGNAASPHPVPPERAVPHVRSHLRLRMLRSPMMHASPALAALAALAVIACGSFRREPGTRGGAAGADSATMVGDAGSADGDASKCSLMVTDIFGGTHDAGWIDMGQTKVANGQAVLVPDLASKAGAIWPRLPSSITTFHARFTAAIAGAADQKGDGLALAWSTNDGNRYGVCQGGNEGLVLETFDRFRS